MENKIEWRNRRKEEAEKVKREAKLIKDNAWQLFSDGSKEEIISCVNYDGEYKLSSDCPDVSSIFSEVYDNERLTRIFSVESSLTIARKHNGKKIGSTNR